MIDETKKRNYIKALKEIKHDCLLLAFFKTLSVIDPWSMVGLNVRSGSGYGVITGGGENGIKIKKHNGFVDIGLAAFFLDYEIVNAPFETDHMRYIKDLIEEGIEND